MATLTDQDYLEIRDAISGSSTKPTFRGLGFSKPIWKAVFQAAETWFTNGFLNTPATSFKGALEAAAGTSLTNQQAIAVGKIWMQWRFSK